MSKVGVSVGFTLQISEYEPVKVTVYHEREPEEGEDAKTHELNVTKEVMNHLREHSKTVVADIQRIKAQIYEDLLDEEV